MVQDTMVRFRQIRASLPGVRFRLAVALFTAIAMALGLSLNSCSSGLSAVAPSITVQPANQSVAVGQTATFTVAATGTSPLMYQWQQNGSGVSGATSASYTTPPTTASNNGSTFQVVVSNSAGSVTSSAATLTVAVGSSGGGSTPASVLTYHNDVASIRHAGLF